MKKIIISFIIISLNTFASDPQVAQIKKGEIAPFTGVLFGPAEDLKLRTQVLERDFFEKENEILKRENELLQKRVDLWKKQSEELSKKLVDRHDDDFWKKALFFGAGVIATIGVAYTFKGATK